MTNYDKHKSEILNLAKTRYSDFYAAEALAAHDISGLADADNVIKWLFDDYEPPLLENGDDLKPGDWIMVRDNGTWSKRRFIGYFEGRFYAKYPLYSNVAASWEQARLPMEGE